MLKSILKKPNNIYVSIGEEGIAVLYFIEGEVSKKLFVRSTKDEDTIELRKIILSDSDAYIHIFIDVLDQTYIQRTLPAISIFNINKLAQQRLEKETIKTHLKGFLQIGRTETGRHDWIYTFISTAFEPPLSDWIKFFEEFNNIIYGIYFLPVELYSAVEKLTKFHKKQHKFKISDIKNIIFTLKSTHNNKSSTWEVILTSNKSGGFRQVIFQNGKVVFTRLLNNLTDPNPDVIAGSIEQEIINSIEYLKRLTTHQKYDININIIVSQEVKKSIRKGKFNAKEIRIYTPYEAANAIDLPEEATKKTDRFCEPMILSLMHTNKRRLITVHTPESEKVLLFTRLFKVFLYALKVTIPVISILILITALHIFSLISEMQGFKTKKNEIINAITDKSQLKQKEEQKLGDATSAKEIQEVVELYNKYTKYDTDPLGLLQKLAGIMPDLAKVTHFQIDYSVPGLVYKQHKSPTDLYTSSNKKHKKFHFIANFTVHFTNFGKSYEDLRKNYDAYKQQLQETFHEYKVKISSLPNNFSLSDLEKPFYLQLVIQTPIENQGLRR